MCAQTRGGRYDSSALRNDVRCDNFKACNEMPMPFYGVGTWFFITNESWTRVLVSEREMIWWSCMHRKTAIRRQHSETKHTWCSRSRLRRGIWAAFKGQGSKRGRDIDTKEELLLICVKHRVMDNKRLWRSNTSRKDKMMIVAHMQQHCEGPGNICYKVFPRMLALSNQGHRWT